ncbi:hypothetical protein [Flavobacterium sp.]|jgi:hypothetical protein|uniref:hypothetical protein n=1 Tax=Flavobacterium sp. TaxID=239 RepID=UPI0037C0A5DB
MDTPTRNRISKLHPSVRNEVTRLESRMIENIDINDGKISLTTKGKNRQVVAQISTEDLKRELQ